MAHGDLKEESTSLALSTDCAGNEGSLTECTQWVVESGAEQSRAAFPILIDGLPLAMIPAPSLETNQRSRETSMGNSFFDVHR